MSLSIICTRCKQPIVAADEDELMAQVEEHAPDHGGAGGTHLPSREHVLTHLHRERPDPSK